MKTHASQTMEDSKRWIVTYTKHVRQKRKVYQDGTLELHSPSNKVLLYDDSGKLLDSRFLKKDDLIQCGAAVTFETHLVDIGELDKTWKPLQNFKVGRSDEKPKEKPGICGQNSKNIFLGAVKKEGQPDKNGSANMHLHDTQATNREWDVLYTAQLTQKAKRYHDGILKVVTCGTHMNQLILLKEDGTTLSSKFQKSAECLSMENVYEMPNYLVEICKERDIQEDQKSKSHSYIQKDSLTKSARNNIKVDKNIEPHSCTQKDSLLNTTKNNMKESQKHELHNSGKLQNYASSEKTSVTGPEEFKINPSENEVTRSSVVNSFTKHKEAFNKKPFRDAFQILSVLRRQPQESLVTIKPAVDQTCHSQSLDSFHPDLLGSNSISGGASLKSVTSPEIPSSGIMKLVSPDCGVELMTENCFASSSLLYAKEPCKASVNHLDGESTEKNSLGLEESGIRSETSSTDLCSRELQIVEQANNEKHNQVFQMPMPWARLQSLRSHQPNLHRAR